MVYTNIGVEMSLILSHIVIIISLTLFGTIQLAQSHSCTDPLLWESIRRGDAIAVAGILNAHQSAPTQDTDRVCSVQGVDINHIPIELNETMPALVLAADLNYTNVVSLLLAHGANPNGREIVYNETALFKASFKGFTEITQMLISYNASATITIKNDETCLMWAAFKGHISIVKLLVEAGADVNAQDTKYGFTPLMVASRNGYIEVVRYLLDLDNIDVNSVDKSGKSALDHAVSKSKDSIVELLANRMKGANEQ